VGRVNFHKWAMWLVLGVCVQNDNESTTCKIAWPLKIKSWYKNMLVCVCVIEMYLTSHSRNHIDTKENLTLRFSFAIQEFLHKQADMNYSR
jgi:hypothetical protein